MKILIIAINSKYIHSSLSCWYLNSNLDDTNYKTKILEFTINDKMDSILSTIYNEEANIVSFSCYIWNTSYILELSEILKTISPNVKIILGGPEVSFDASNLLKEHYFIDYIIKYEGESIFKQLINCLYYKNIEIQNIDGIAYRENKKIIENKNAKLIHTLDTIKSPYVNSYMENIKDRIVYFESSRGCPFSCSYCISSTFDGVRYFSLERVKNDLIKLINSHVKQIKFVDRTFNANKKRAIEIFKFIIKTNTHKTNFHFEVAGDLFDDDILKLLKTVPNGLIQFEIGIQSTNTKTLDAVNRKTNLEKVFYNIKKLIEFNNINIHVDLIAGLPFEDISSFQKSFNDVYALRPHMIQLGFLKMLKGSGIRKNAEKFNYKYKKNPTYEILSNNFISYQELSELKNIEEIVEKFYNSFKFVKSLDYLIRNSNKSAFLFYRDLAKFCISFGFTKRSFSLYEVYDLLMRFSKTIIDASSHGYFNELLKFDYLSSEKNNNPPDFINRNIKHGFKDKCYKFLKNANNLHKYLKNFCDMAPKEIYKKVHFEIFCYNIKNENIEKTEVVILFDYSKKCQVTGLYKHFLLSNF